MLFLGLAVGLLFYTFKEISFTQLVENLYTTKYSWLILSIGVATLSHITRAYRWIILLEPIGYKPKLSNTFYAVMVGYMANFIVPRMGEVTRCGMLRKTDGIPADASFGTVITERIFDLFTLILLIIINLLIEKELKSFFGDYFMKKLAVLEGFQPIIIGFFITMFIGVVIVFLKRKKIVQSALYLKIRGILSGFLKGIFSFRSIRRKKAFFISTFLMWFLYWAMVQIAVNAYPEIAHFGFVETFTLLIVGGIAMSAPVQGGIGAYHLMVGSVLTIYGLDYDSGVSAATILHSSQMIMIIVVGAMSLVAIIIKESQFKKKQ